MKQPGFRRYYEDELAYLRELGDAFSRANPRIAGMLSQRATDPDVERLLEGFAFLTGKLRQRLDEELPELSHGLLALLWPHYLRPLPAMSIVEFQPDPAGLPVVLPSGTAVAARPIEGTSCQFRVCGALTVVPVTLSAATLEDRPNGAVLSLTVTAAANADAAAAVAGGLRLYLHGERDARISPVLLRAVLRDMTALRASDGQRGVALAPRVRQVGFADDEALLPWPENSAPGYRLLQEYLAFPERFLFVDLPPLPATHGLSGPAITYTATLARPAGLPAPIGPQHIRLNCAPVINLFDTEADPIRPERGRIEYRVRPPTQRDPHARVYEIRRVRGFVQGQPAPVVFDAFETFRHAMPGGTGHFFRAHLRPATLGRGADVWLSFVDGADGALVPGADMVTADITCTNGQLVELVPIGGIDQHAAGSLATGRFRNITPVLPEVPPPFGSDALWRLVSGLARSLRPLDDVAMLRQLIASYDFRAVQDDQARRRLELLLGGLREVATEGFDTMVRGIPVRGREVRLTVDRGGFMGLGDVFLFATVFDAFLGVYGGLNSAWRLRVLEAQTNTEFLFPTRLGRTQAL